MSDTEAPSGPLMNTYPPQRVTFVEGRGTELFDSAGKRYLDFLSGLAVTSLGHGHEAVARAMFQQARKLTHVSNLFGTEPGLELARQLDGLIGGGGKVFFANSGAEANEAALKLARKWGGVGRHTVITVTRSFHGRTLATLHATGQPEKHGPFQPLPPGFIHVPWQDTAALENAIDETTAAVLIEPIQGEGGVNEGGEAYLSAVQALCSENNLLFMVDEVQTGLGRTGEWFAFQHYGLSPDVVTIAKALGNGMPIGAAWARDDVASAFSPGDHATTFGGQPLAAATASKVIEILIDLDAPSLAKKAGDQLRTGLALMLGVADVRGLGLLLAAELVHADAHEIANGCLDRGLVVNAVTKSAIRLAPPLNVTSEEIDEALGILRSVLT